MKSQLDRHYYLYFMEMEIELQDSKLLVYAVD